MLDKATKNLLLAQEMTVLAPSPLRGVANLAATAATCSYKAVKIPGSGHGSGHPHSLHNS